MTFRKERVAGIWVNADSRTFVKAPSYLTVLANRTINDIADINTLRRTQTGLARTLLPQEISGDIADSIRDDPFRQAFLRLKIDQKLYGEQQNGVTFLTPALFRAAIPIPDNAPTGSYEVDVKLFADGALLARTQTALEVVKVGFEQFVAQRGARPRPALRPRHRHDGAAHRLVRERGVPQGLMLLSSLRETGRGTERPSRHLGARELHHLAPLLGLVGDELGELGGRAGQQRGAHLGEACLRLLVGEHRVHRLVQRLDDLGRRAFRRAEAVPGARLVARHVLARPSAGPAAHASVPSR